MPYAFTPPGYTPVLLGQAQDIEGLGAFTTLEESAAEGAPVLMKLDFVEPPLEEVLVELEQACRNAGVEPWPGSEFYVYADISSKSVYLVWPPGKTGLTDYCDYRSGSVSQRPQELPRCARHYFPMNNLPSPTTGHCAPTGRSCRSQPCCPCPWERPAPVQSRILPRGDGPSRRPRPCRDLPHPGNRSGPAIPAPHLRHGRL